MCRNNYGSLDWPNWKYEQPSFKEDRLEVNVPTVTHSITVKQAHIYTLSLNWLSDRAAHVMHDDVDIIEKCIHSTSRSDLRSPILNGRGSRASTSPQIIESVLVLSTYLNWAVAFRNSKPQNVHDLHGVRADFGRKSIIPVLALIRLERSGIRAYLSSLTNFRERTPLAWPSYLRKFLFPGTCAYGSVSRKSW